MGGSAGAEGLCLPGSHISAPLSHPPFPSNCSLTTHRQALNTTFLNLGHTKLTIFNNFPLTKTNTQTPFNPIPGHLNLSTFPAVPRPLPHLLCENAEGTTQQSEIPGFKAQLSPWPARGFEQTLPDPIYSLPPRCATSSTLPSLYAGGSFLGWNVC